MSHLGGWGGLPGPSRKPCWALQAVSRAPRHVWAPTEPREQEAIHAGRRTQESGGPLSILQKPDQTSLGILPR
eukprot:6186126-Pyramimonas_sp.AAC.1